MPNQDGTGPSGTGRPGRGLGPCGRRERELIQPRRCFGRGFRFRNGFGMRSQRMWLDGQMSNKQDIYPYTRQELEEQKETLERQLAWLKNQLNNTKDE